MEASPSPFILPDEGLGMSSPALAEVLPVVAVPGPAAAVAPVVLDEASAEFCRGFCLSVPL